MGPLPTNAVWRRATAWIQAWQGRGVDNPPLEGILRAIVDTTLQKIWEGFSSASATEQLATLSGIVGVWLMIRQCLWAFPVGLVQVSLSAIVFFRARFYADMKLQAVFFVVLAYGWWHWSRGASPERPASTSKGLPITQLDGAGWCTALGAGIFGTLAWGWYLASFTDAAMPYRDAFIASFSVVAQWLQARKKIENWFGWILVNATAVPVYWLGGMPWFSVLYLLFLGMAVGGWLEWRRSLNKAAMEAPKVDAPARNHD